MQEDEVRVSNGKLYINGMKQDEPFTTVDANYEFWPVLVPDGSLLVLGDNRNHSLDGQIWVWGFLPSILNINVCYYVFAANLRCENGKQKLWLTCMKVTKL